jgi:hypothetical protein
VLPTLTRELENPRQTEGEERGKVNVPLISDKDASLILLQVKLLKVNIIGGKVSSTWEG